MTIHLSKDAENAINAAVQSGRFASPDAMLDELVREFAQRAKPAAPKSKVKTGKRARPLPAGKKLTDAEFDRHLLATGLISQLPDTAADFDDPNDEPIAIKGEPLSETIIRERR